MNGLWWKAASCSQSTQEAVFFFKNYLFILVVLGLRCFAQAFSVGESRGSSLFWCSGFSLWWFLVLQSTGSRRIGSVVVVHRLSCSAACGIFLDQGLNLCLLHWQAVLYHWAAWEALDVFLVVLMHIVKLPNCFTVVRFFLWEACSWRKALIMGYYS